MLAKRLLRQIMFYGHENSLENTWKSKLKNRNLLKEQKII